MALAAGVRQWIKKDEPFGDFPVVDPRVFVGFGRTPSRISSLYETAVYYAKLVKYPFQSTSL